MALLNDTSAPAGETYIQRMQRLGQTTPTATAPATSTQAPAASTGGISSPTVTPTRTSTSQPTKPAPSYDASGTPSTPVTGDGKIPAPSATPQPQAQAVLPNQGQVYSTQWQMPAATPAPAPSTTPTGNAPVNTGAQPVGQPLQAMNLGDQAFRTYQASQFNVPVPTIGELPQSYQGSQFDQFHAPDQQRTTGAQMALLNQILMHPETMNADVLAQQKEKEKEASLLMEQQGLQAANENAAARGMTNGGGLAGLLAQIQQQAGNQVLTQNRDLDLAALEKNRQDQLNALNIADAVMGGQMNRATQGYGATLAGQSAQAGDTRNVSQDAIQRALSGFGANMQSAGMNLQQQGMNADERFKQYGTERSAQDADINRILQQFGMNQAASSLGLQSDLGHGGLALDQRRLDSQNRQFDQGFGLDTLRFLEGARQADNNLGFNYNQLQQNGQNTQMGQILSILGLG